MVVTFSLTLWLFSTRNQPDVREPREGYIKQTADAEWAQIDAETVCGQRLQTNLKFNSNSASSSRQVNERERWPGDTERF